MNFRNENDKFCIKIGDFNANIKGAIVARERYGVGQVMNILSKMVNILLKMMDFALQMADFGAACRM